MRIVILALLAVAVAFAQNPCPIRTELLQYPLLSAWTEATAVVNVTFTVDSQGNIVGSVQMDGPKEFLNTVNTAIVRSKFAPGCARSRSMSFEFRIRDEVGYSFDQVVVELDPNHYAIAVRQRYLYPVYSALARPSWPKRLWRALTR